MQNDMRDRLIKLLYYVGDNVMQFKTENFIESLADYLIANDAIVKPSKEFCRQIGNSIYCIDKGDVIELLLCSVGFDYEGEDSITAAYQVGNCEAEWYSYKFSDIGKTVFLTQEEAEQALKERENNV